MAKPLHTLTSIATTALEGDLTDKLTLIARAGFKGVDIHIADIENSRLDIRQIKERLDTLGLAPVCLQPLQDFTGVGDYSEQSERLAYFFSIMEVLETDLLLMTSTSTAKANPNLQRHKADLYAAAELAQARQKRIGYEALAWGHTIYSYWQAWEVIKELNHPSLGLVIDSFHLLSRNDSLNHFHHIPADRLFMIHLADAPNRDVFLGQCHDDVCKQQLADWSQHGRRLPGLGEFKLGPLYEALFEIGYQGPVSLEIFRDRHRKGTSEEWLQAAFNSLQDSSHAIHGR